MNRGMHQIVLGVVVKDDDVPSTPDVFPAKKRGSPKDSIACDSSVTWTQSMVEALLCRGCRLLRPSGMCREDSTAENLPIAANAAA